jgi:hypothetical protein
MVRLEEVYYIEGTLFTKLDVSLIPPIKFSPALFFLDL